MQIRQEQMAALGEHMYRQFVQRTVEHCRRYFPAQCRELGDEGTREMVCHGSGRAEAHGFTAQCDVSKYIDIMFAHGRDYDVDPKLPWARRILESAGFRNPGERINALCDEAIARQSTGDPSDGH